MNNPAYLTMPIIRVVDVASGNTHIVGTDLHDRLYLDENGQIQYENIQCICGTRYGEYRFVSDNEGHEPVKNKITAEDVGDELWVNLTDEDLHSLEMVEPIDYAKETYEKKIRELDEWNIGLLQKQIERMEEHDAHRSQ